MNQSFNMIVCQATLAIDAILYVELYN